MNRFETLTSVASAIGVAVGLLAAEAARKWLESQGVDSALLFAVIWVVVIAVTVLVRFAAEQALYGSRLVRRLLLGRRYVEGTWIDAVAYADGRLVVGVVRLEPDKNSLRYGGDNFDEHGKPLGRFDTRALRLDWPSLHFTYTAVDPTEALDGVAGHAVLEGLGVIRFHERDGWPLTFSGECIDTTQGRHELRGRRVVDDDELKRLDTLNGRAEAARAFARDERRREQAAASLVPSPSTAAASGQDESR